MSNNLQLSLLLENANTAGLGGDYFLSDGGIRGTVIVHNARQRSFDLVKVSLEGFLVNVIHYGDWPRVQQQDFRKLQVLLCMSDVKKRSDFGADNTLTERSMRCSFNFDLPQCLERNLSGEDADYLSDLPASMSSSETLKEGMNAQKFCLGESRIHYAIRADVIRNEKTVATMTKPIEIIPCLKSRPLVCSNDFGSEYSTKVSKPVRGKGRLSLNKLGTCTVEASQPESVVIEQLNAPITISVPLTLSLSKDARDELQLKQRISTALDNSTICHSALVSSTYISVLPRREVPTPAEADRSNKLTRNVSVCSRADTALIRTGDWEHNSSSGVWQIKATATFSFNAFKDKKPVIPSFDSSLVSHRYRLTLKVEMNISAEVSFLLDIPITIRYCSDTASPPSTISNQIDVSSLVQRLSISSSNSRRPSTIPLPAITEEEPAEDVVAHIVPVALSRLSHPTTPPEFRDLMRYQLPSYHPHGVTVGGGVEAPPYVV